MHERASLETICTLTLQRNKKKKKERNDDSKKQIFLLFLFLTLFSRVISCMFKIMSLFMIYKVLIKILFTVTQSTEDVN